MGPKTTLLKTIITFITMCAISGRCSQSAQEWNGQEHQYKEW